MILGSSILGVPYVVANSNVLSSVTIVGQTGTYVVVAPSSVQQGVTFGANSSQVGTFTGGGGGGFPLGG